MDKAQLKPIGDPPSATVDRLRVIMASIEMSCSCRDEFDAALSRFISLEVMREMRRALHLARKNRETILALATMLQELDEIGLREPDSSVFNEMALVFGDISTAAQLGAGALRTVAAISHKKEQ